MLEAVALTTEPLPDRLGARHNLPMVILEINLLKFINLTKYRVNLMILFVPIFKTLDHRIINFDNLTINIRYELYRYIVEIDGATYFFSYPLDSVSDDKS